MPASDDLFNPEVGDKFIRSLSGLAYSDREIQEMRDWMKQCDAILPGVFKGLAECLSAASDCMMIVSPISSGWREKGPESALMECDGRLKKLTERIERLAKAAKFPKKPFYVRHFIPSGGMPDGLYPREFDETRNDEAVYDVARAAAIANSEATKKAAEKDKEDAEAARRAADEERAPQGRETVALIEYVKQLSGQTRKRFQQRLSDADFRASAIATMNACSHCIAAAAGGLPDKLAEGESLLRSSAGSDSDLRAMAHFYFDYAQQPVSDVIELLGRPKADKKKALAEVSKLKKRFDKASEPPAEPQKVSKPRLRKNA